MTLTSASQSSCPAGVRPYQTVGGEVALVERAMTCWRSSFRSQLVRILAEIFPISNPLNDDYTDFILPWDTSGAEQLQARLPESRVVGAFKNVWWEVFDAPRFGETLSDVFVVGDDAGAKETFFEATQGTPFRYIDAGNLKNARTIERMTLLSGGMGQRYGFFPRMNYKLLGEPWRPGSADAIAPLIARP